MRWTTIPPKYVGPRYTLDRITLYLIIFSFFLSFFIFIPLLICAKSSPSHQVRHCTNITLISGIRDTNLRKSISKKSISLKELLNKVNKYIRQEDSDMERLRFQQWKELEVKKKEEKSREGRDKRRSPTRC